MNFGELKAAVRARGLDFQTDAQVGVWVNDAYLELCDQEDWPFLQASASGALPLTISDLGVVQTVTTSAGVKLEPADLLQLAEDFGDLTVTGTACFYYATASTLTSYPVDTGSVTVRYWRVPSILSADSDVPVVPARFHRVIIAAALRMAFADESDSGDYQVYDAEWARGLQTMRERVLLSNRDGNTGQIMVAGHGDA